MHWNTEWLQTVTPALLSIHFSHLLVDDCMSDCLSLGSAFNWKSSSQAVKVIFILCLHLKTRLSDPCCQLGLKLRGEKKYAREMLRSSLWHAELPLMNCWFFVEMRRDKFFHGSLQWRSNTKVKQDDWPLPTLRIKLQIAIDSFNIKSQSFLYSDLRALQSI